jgi:hypothetical protein
LSDIAPLGRVHQWQNRPGDDLSISNQPMDVSFAGGLEGFDQLLEYAINSAEN